MLLSEVSQKPGSEAGAQALMTFFGECMQEPDVLGELHDWITKHAAGVESGDTPDIYVNVLPNASGYSVKVENEATALHALVLHSTSDSGSTIDQDSPIDTVTTFQLPASAAVVVATSDADTPDDLYNLLQRVLKMAGGIVYRVRKTFGSTIYCKQQEADLEAD